jgi:hypothetical protein
MVKMSGHIDSASYGGVSDSKLYACILFVSYLFIGCQNTKEPIENHDADIQMIAVHPANCGHTSQCVAIYIYAYCDKPDGLCIRLPSPFGSLPNSRMHHSLDIVFHEGENRYTNCLRYYDACERDSILKYFDRDIDIIGVPDASDSLTAQNYCNNYVGKYVIRRHKNFELFFSDSDNVAERCRAKLLKM